MDETINTSNEQQPTTQPADNGNQGGSKLFTQEEVNQIIKERLSRERAKAAPQEPTEAEKRERELTARESRLNCRAYLLDKRYPSELLDVLDTSDFAKFKKAADTVSGLIGSRLPPAPLRDSDSCYWDRSKSVASGFESGRKHTPRQYPPHFDD